MNLKHTTSGQCTNGWFACVSLLACLCACSSVPEPLSLQSAAAGQGSEADLGCTVAYELSNRYLGPLFTLQIVNDEAKQLVVAPPRADRQREALWQFVATGPNHNVYRMRTLSHPDLWLIFDLVLRPEATDSEWRIEEVEGEARTNVPLYWISPANDETRTLDTDPTPPYRTRLNPGRGDAGQSWRLEPRTYCDVDAG